MTDHLLNFGIVSLIQIIFCIFVFFIPQSILGFKDNYKMILKHAILSVLPALTYSFLYNINLFLAIFASIIIAVLIFQYITFGTSLKRTRIHNAILLIFLLLFSLILFDEYSSDYCRETSITARENYYRPIYPYYENQLDIPKEEYEKSNKVKFCDSIGRYTPNKKFYGGGVVPFGFLALHFYFYTIVYLIMFNLKTKPNKS